MGIFSVSPLLYKNWRFIKTSVLHRLQAETLPNATPQLGKIPLFTKIAITFKPKKYYLDALKDLKSPKKLKHSLFYDRNHHL